MSSPELLLLYQALAEPIGLAVESDNVPLAVQRLQKAKRESGDPKLSVIQIRPAPKGEAGEIWLTRKAQEEQSSATDV